MRRSCIISKKYFYDQFSSTFEPFCNRPYGTKSVSPNFIPLAIIRSNSGGQFSGPFFMGSENPAQAPLM
jgi:hypothetical protein